MSEETEGTRLKLTMMDGEVLIIDSSKPETIPITIPREDGIWIYWGEMSEVTIAKTIDAPKEKIFRWTKRYNKSAIIKEEYLDGKTGELRFIDKPQGA